MSKLFYKKLLEAYDIKLLSNNFIFSSISWCTDHRYRKYVTLNNFLSKQLEHPQDELVELAWNLTDRNSDKTVVNIVKWVTKNVKYKSDPYEEWKGAFQTFLDKYGDCDDMNCLVYVLCYLAGVHPFQLFCGIGKMTTGGHYWCMYYSVIENKMVSLDTTYYANTLSVKNRPDFNELKYHIDMWYMFNSDICVKPI